MFSRARHERFRESDALRGVFERVVGACIAAGLVGGEGFAVDASLTAADANKQRSIPGKDWDKKRDPETASRAVKEYLATLDDAAFGAASDVTPKFVSPSDPAAQWTGAMRGPAFFAYADNYLIDVKFGVIMDVEASRAIRQAEVGAAKTMIERTEERFGVKPERLAADTAYGSAANLDWLVNEKQIAPHIPVIDKSKREDGTFSREDFTFDKARDIYMCPAGEVLRTTGTVSTDHAMRYIAPVPVCRRARSNPSAARTCPPAGSCATSTRTPATWLERWPRRRPSSNPAATASASRCCSPISSASSGSAASACAARAEHKTSSRSQPSPRTCAGLPSSSPDRRHRPRRALRKRRVRQCQCVKAAVPMGRAASSSFDNPRLAPSRSSDRRLLQQNLPTTHQGL